jgi:hypothetical protein
LGALTDFLELLLNLGHHLGECLHVDLARHDAHAAARVRIAHHHRDHVSSVPSVAIGITAARLGSREPRRKDGAGGQEIHLLHLLHLLRGGLLIGDGDGENAGDEADETKSLDLHGEERELWMCGWKKRVDGLKRSGCRW